MVTKYGIYNYETLGFDGVLISHQVDVKVIAETEKSYKIQLLGFTHNRVPNQMLWVSKRKIKINKEVPNEKEEECNLCDSEDFDVNRYWWQNL
jgi:hypothetical protein